MCMLFCCFTYRFLQRAVHWNHLQIDGDEAAHDMAMLYRFRPRSGDHDDAQE